MSNELGKLIGKIEKSFTITSHDGTAKNYQMKLTLDCSTASDESIKKWIASDRVIAFCRPNRSLSLTELEELNGRTIFAQSVGTKIKSRSESINEYVEKGFPRKLAEIAVDDPAKFKTIMDTVESEIE